MSSTSLTSRTRSALGRGLAVGRLGQDVLGVLGFCALTAVLAQVRVPLPGTPVPMTLQVLAVLLCGMFLRPAAAAAAMVVYVGAGVMLPFLFAPGSSGLTGITGGYLLGFIPAATAVSVLRGRPTGMPRTVVAAAVGSVAVLAFGAFWQMALFAWTPAQAFAVGIGPFLPKAAVQVGLVTVIVKLVRKEGAPIERESAP